MLNGACYVCTDVKKFERAVNDVKRINYSINRYLMRFDYDKSNRLTREEEILLRQISLDKKHIHFMCGKCFKVNESELLNAEKELKNNFIKVVRVLKLHENDKKTNALRKEVANLLRGHYPKMASVLIRKNL